MRTKQKIELQLDTFISILNKYPDNRNQAFKEFSKIINLRVSQIQGYYYNTIFKSDIIIGTTGSSEGFTTNRKNTPVKKGQQFKREEPLSPVFIILENFMYLTSVEKTSLKKIINKL